MSARSRHRLTLLAAASLLAGGALAAAACSDDPARPQFEPPEAGGDVVVLPETSAPDVATPPEVRDPFDPSPEPVVCAADASPCAVELTAGSRHVCARMKDGTVRCWGDDTRGSLGARAPRGDAGAGDAGDAGPGDGGAGDAGGSVVNTVYGLANVAQISAAGATTCARLEDGGVVCWGANTDGLLGLTNKGAPITDEDPHPIPSSIALPSAASRVDVGPSAACAVLTAGPVVCWGRDDQKQLARAPFDAGGAYPPIGAPAPAELPGLQVARVAGGTFSGLALTASGEVWSWGALAGDLGLVSGRVSSVSPDRTPRRIVQLEKVTSLAISPTITPEPPPPDDDGVGTSGGIGIGLGPIPFPPEPVPHAHACAIAAGEVYCWGRSERGALCSGIPDPSQVPLHAPIRTKAWPQQLSVGDESTCARMTDGTVMCCGDDTRGRLGTGKLVVHSAFFTKAEAFTGRAVQVVNTNDSVCALVQGGTVECWGDNRHGELGRGKPDALAHPTPAKVAF
ncbi:MAG: hypothetical protein JST00_29635 [Deltaproteobacteria bacterium]|nr:hypothetical protein [Deltaproteobacteria bacterium]